MDIQFTKGTAEHLGDCIKAIENSALGKSYFQSEESRKNAVMEGIDSGNLYVVLCDGECAGFAYFILEGAFHAYHYLHLIAIREEYRGKGIGRTSGKLFLLVGDYNPGAKVFYEKLGYKFVGTIPSLYRKGINEYLMMKVFDSE